MTREEAICILERVRHTEAKWPGTEDTLEDLKKTLKNESGITLGE